MLQQLKVRVLRSLERYTGSCEVKVIKFIITVSNFSVSVRANIQARINVNDGIRDNNDEVVIG